MTIRIKYSSCVNFKPQENHQESQRHINGQPLHEEDSMLRVFFSLYKFYFLGNLTGGSMFTTRPVKINSKETCIPITSSLVDDHDQEFKEILTVMGVPGRKAIEDPKKDGIGNYRSLDIEAGQIPATKSSIDALERVVFDGSSSTRDCTVCMEEIEGGSEATRMPCSHVYHSDCISQWLQTSHLCPLCRYHMPGEL
ncbi:E3 ubiquitin-protein ligase SIRP1 [Populus alba x Populus x berolinensis]|nr:E3 ubiquitin-protein ligase SIRP1 [Populus alba x Populus x berolinensis]